jgi:hypothetical protein
VLDADTYGQFADRPEGFDAPAAWQPIGEAGTDWLDIAPLATLVLTE